MLHFTDQAFLAAAVRHDLVPPAQAGPIAQQYQGQPGGLGQALVQAGVISEHARQQLELELKNPGTQRLPSDVNMEGTARIGAPRQDTKSFGTDRPPSGRFGSPMPTPGSQRFSQQDSGSKRLSLPGRVPEIPGYVLTRELGRGGMGAVYQATRQSDGKQVAIKVLINAGERQIQRFEREAQAMERLRHPNVVPLLESGQVNGKPFLVMGFVEGGDLHGALDRGDLDTDEALRIIAKVARAIAHAHNLDILHRDLKPANILLDARNEPRVTDFGLAKILDRETQLTRTHATLGTPHYMAPEQVTGEEYRPAVDVYALGVMLYQIVTQELPFQESGVALFRQIREERPRRPWDVGEVDKDLGRLILWALEKEPADRPSCMELANGIEAYLGGEQLELKGGASLVRLYARPILVGLGALMLLIALGVGGLALHRWRRDQARIAAADQALEALQDALGAARRARKGNDLDGLLAEASAHREVAEQLAAVPASRREEAEGKVEAAQAVERRREVLQLAVPLLIAADRGPEALELAEEHAALAPGQGAELLLARAEATDPNRAARAHQRVAGLVAQRKQLAPALRARLARTLLGLHRPTEAVTALDEAPAEQLALRAEARLASGDLDGARDDLLASLQQVGRDVGVATLLARVEGRRGQPEVGLKQLNRLKAGSDPRFHAARAELLARLGRPGAAKLAFEQAFTTATDDAPRRAALKVQRGRFQLARGRRLEAEPDLLEARDPAARLDLALSRWIGGGPQAAAVAVLGELSQGFERLQAARALSAAAARWLARVQVAEGQLDAARAAATRAWALEPSARSAEARAWVALRANDAQGAEEALAASPTPAKHAELQVRIALARKHTIQTQTRIRAARQAEALDAPTRALLRLLATPIGEGSHAKRADLVYQLQRRGEGEGVVPVPRGSREPAQPRQALVARLYHEAVRLQGRILNRRDPVQPQVERILQRAIGLEPDHLAARVDLARLQRRVEPLLRVIERAPTLTDARRTRLSVAQARKLAQEPFDAEAMAQDIAHLLRAPDLRDTERVSFAQMLLRRRDLAGAWRVLEPALRAEKNRRLRAFQLGVQLATRLGKPAEAARCKTIVAQIEATIRDVSPLLREANVGEDISELDKATRALRRIQRDLPHIAYYHRLHAQLQFGRGAWVLAVLDGGEFMTLQRRLGASQPSLWLYGFAWAEAAPQELIPRVAREKSEERPNDAGPWLAQALFYGARFYLKKPRDPEDVELAADRALRGVHLHATSGGALSLAANLLLSAKDFREAVALIETALAADPGCKFAVMQRARLAAWKRQPTEMIGYLKQLSFNRTLKRQLVEDDSFDRVREHPDVVAFFQEMGVPSKKD